MALFPLAPSWARQCKPAPPSPKKHPRMRKLGGSQTMIMDHRALNKVVHFSHTLYMALLFEEIIGTSSGIFSCFVGPC